MAHFQFTAKLCNMKIRVLIIIVLLAAGIFILFRMRNTGSHTVVVQGNWQLDSIHTGKDSNIIYMMLLQSLQTDSGRIDFRFTQDSLYTFTGEETDTTAYRYDPKSGHISIGKSDDEEVYSVAVPADSTLSFTASDGTILYLKKQR